MRPQGESAAAVLSVPEAADLLGVCDATVRNWIKKGLLAASTATGRITIDAQAVRHLHRSLNRGATGGRLRTRANKTRAGGRRIPREQAAGAGEMKHVEAALRPIREAGLPAAAVLFLLGLNRLVAMGLMTPAQAERAADGDSRHLARKHLAAELIDFRSSLGAKRMPRAAKRLLTCPLPESDDPLGLVYQSLTRLGARSRSGRYYTPHCLAASIAENLFRSEIDILDPCCGSGAFLLAFAKRGAEPGRLFGFDIDPLAVRIARLNLFAAYPNMDFSPNIFLKDSLMPPCRGAADADAGRYGVIATNPPWGARMGRNKDRKLRENYPDIVSGESFSYFVRRSLDLLAPDGVASFILPEAFLNVARHRDIRDTLTALARVDRVERLERVFDDVFTPAIRVDVSRRRGKTAAGGTRMFRIHAGGGDARLIDKILKHPHALLAGNADWALGIVTGDNRRHLAAVPRKGFEPVYRGRDIVPFRFRAPGTFIRFRPEAFQQVAQERLYRSGEKLVYRFVSRRLVFAHDRRGRLTLNSANIVIPRLPGYPLAAVAALFNSTLFQFLYAKLFASLKVLRSHLERLPLPLWDDGALARLAAFADGLADGTAGMEGLDELVMRGFGLTGPERNRVRAFAPPESAV